MNPALQFLELVDKNAVQMFNEFIEKNRNYDFSKVDAPTLHQTAFPAPTFMTNKQALYLLIAAIVLAAFTSRWMLDGPVPAFNAVNLDTTYFDAQWVAFLMTAGAIGVMVSNWQKGGEFPRPILLGVATLIFFLMPWLDKSPVKSIRYKGSYSRWALTTFVVVFLVLGYYGTQSVTAMGTLISQVGTLIYFAFFLLMPWYTQMEQTLPVPDRVTG